ncbi:MAG: hypothetical protein ACM3ML_36295 [Micromonosporaceae bacterium]
MKSRHIAIVAGVAFVAAAATGASAAISFSGPPTPGPAAASNPGASSYSYYRSMMNGSYGGPMMGGPSRGWMMGAAGYRWMMGGAAAPGWMRGGALPGFMMGKNHDPGKVMGSLFADAPGARVSPDQAARLGGEAPAGAAVDPVANRVSFSGTSVHFAVVASPAGGRDETFRVAGLVNPSIVVKAGARVSIEVVNADPDTAHGLVITAPGTASSWMPMMTASPAFNGSALWFLGNPTSEGMHAATMSFTAGSAGDYEYLCPVPRHAQEGMAGKFIVTQG